MKKTLKMIIPKGRIQQKVVTLLDRIGCQVNINERSYRPSCRNPEIEVKLLKPQNIPMLVALGRHDCGFTGYDWISEQQADTVELLDLGFDPVSIVAAMPDALAKDYALCKKKLVVASEYRRLSLDYIKRKGLDTVFVQSFGATEALPPEDADMIIDNISTGETLKSNRLTIIDEIMRSTTRFIASKQALDDPFKRKLIEELAMFMKSALNADSRVLLEMNVPADRLEGLVRDLPCMRAPTVSPLHNEEGYAIKIAVPSSDVPSLIPRLISLGARDILEYRLEKIVAS